MEDSADTSVRGPGAACRGNARGGPGKGWVQPARWEVRGERITEANSALEAAWLPSK